MKTNNYKERDGCHNCGHVCVESEYDTADYLFCVRVGRKKPQVAPWAICDEHYRVKERTAGLGGEDSLNINIRG